jgi:hypothetical protein
MFARGFCDPAQLMPPKKPHTAASLNNPQTVHGHDPRSCPVNVKRKFHDMDSAGRGVATALKRRGAGVLTYFTTIFVNGAT